MTQVSWLIPTYNEEKNICQVVKEIPVGVPFVLDKSADRTAIYAAEAGAVVVPRRGSGKGDAVREGIELLSPCSHIIIIIDGDNTYSPKEVSSLLKEIEYGADMVIGSRFLGHMEKEAMTRLHVWGNKLFNIVLNLRFGSDVTDLLSGFRAIRVSALKQVDLGSSGFDIEVELTAKFLKNGFRVVERPISYRKRLNGSKSKLNFFKDGWRILVAIIKT